MINRQEAPAITNPIDFNLQLLQPEKYILDNGVQVYAINAGSQELTMVEMVFFAGNCFEEKNIVAATTNFLLKNGTSNKTALAINEKVDFHGAFLNRSCQNETATFTLHTLNKHIENLLPLMGEILTDSIFPEHELAIYKQNQLQKLQVNLKKCDFVANRLIDEYTFGFQHPYGKYTSTIAYEALEQSDMVSFYNKFYKNGKCIIFVAGKLPNNLPSLLNKYFGSLNINNQTIQTPVFTAHSATEKKYRIVNDANGVQGAIRLAMPFPNRHHPHFSKVQVLNNIFGGFFGSRLMSNIREDKGYTYGIHSYLQNLIQQTSWLISTEAGRDVCDATIVEVYKEMERLRNETIEDDELELVRNYMIGSLLGNLDGPFQVINRWKSYVLNGVTEQYFYNAVHTIKTVSAMELQEMANIYLHPENFYELVVV
jgi:zinc protease